MDKKIGNGPVAKRGHKVKVSYVLRLNNQQGRIMERSDKKFGFTLGHGEVIQGWELGVPGMRVGGKRVLIIPPQLAYGKQKAGNIPPNSTLCFEIELFEVK